jgi:hypothetical protein
LNDQSISNQTDETRSKTLVLQKEIESKFIDNLFIYKSPKEAALRAGYSESYAANIKSLKLRDPKFLARIKDQYNGNATLLLPEIFQSEANSVSLSNSIIDSIKDAIDQAPDLETKIELSNKALNVLAKAAPVRKELKQTAGVLATEGQTTVNMVNIESIQALIANNHDDMVNPKPDTD